MVGLQETHSFCLHVFSNFPTWSAYYLCDSFLETGCLGSMLFMYALWSEWFLLGMRRPGCFSEDVQGKATPSRLWLQMSDSHPSPTDGPDLIPSLFLPGSGYGGRTGESLWAILLPSAFQEWNDSKGTRTSCIVWMVTILQTASYLKNILRCSR